MRKIMESVAEYILSYIDTKEKRDKTIINIGKFTMVGGSIVTLILIYGIINK